MISVINETVSLILVPALIVVLSFLLVLLLAPKKTNTLATLAYELQKLTALCEQNAPDLKALKKIDMAAAKCALLADRASFEQKQDIGCVPDKIEEARKILHALHDAKTAATECAPYLEIARNHINGAYAFLINTLGITAAPRDANLKFFRKNMRSENAKTYLESLRTDSPKVKEKSEKQ